MTKKEVEELIEHEYLIIHLDGSQSIIQGAKLYCTDSGILSMRDKDQSLIYYCNGDFKEVIRLGDRVEHTPCEKFIYRREFR